MHTALALFPHGLCVQLFVVHTAQPSLSWTLHALP